MAGRAISIIAVWVIAVSVVGVDARAQSVIQPTERFVLTGLIYVEGGRGVAWLQEPTLTHNQIVTVRLGDSIGPYRLTKILDDQVELEGPGGKVAIPLAGMGGAISVAAIPETSNPPTHDLAPHPAINNPDAVVVSRGDPSRNFPVPVLGSGPAPNVDPSGGGRGPSPSRATAASRAPDIGILPTSMQTPPTDLPPHAGLNNPGATIVPRGDPRRNFPASELLVGAGAPLFTRQ